MSYEESKEKYLKQTQICSETDYAEKNSVRKRNSAVKEMYRIVNSIAERNDQVEILNFADLLNIEENRTNIWAAVQILEKLDVDNKTEHQALEIIKKAACGVDPDALGFQLWLENYVKKE